MNIELTEQEIEMLVELIQQTWCDGFGDEVLDSAFEKLRDAQDKLEGLANGLD